MSRKYTQREWDREVGWGEVPPEYAYDTDSSQDPVQEHEDASDNSDEAYKKSMEIV